MLGPVSGSCKGAQLTTLLSTTLLWTGGLRRIALFGPLLFAALLVGGYIAIHQPFARDGTRLVPVSLSPDDPSITRVGALSYRGGIDIPRMGQNIGGLSALRWDAQSGRLLALTDDARWVWMTLSERGDRLVGLEAVETGPLLGLNGEPLTGKAQGDSESLTRSAQGGWLVGFEREHRIWRYPELPARPEPTGLDPQTIMGPLEANGGTETLAVDERALFVCAERETLQEARAREPNCFWQTQGMGPSGLRVDPPQDMRDVNAVPTDADMTSDAAILVLFRSYSPSRGNICGITALNPDGSQKSVATFKSPLNVDNFEGLAVREEGNRTFLFIVSDANFSARQRTLLMKIEWGTKPG